MFIVIMFMVMMMTMITVMITVIRAYSSAAVNIDNTITAVGSTIITINITTILTMLLFIFQNNEFL